MPRTYSKRRRQAGSGRVRQLPSGRWQAQFPGPDGVLRAAPKTFDTKLDAHAWCDRQVRDLASGLWTPRESTADSHQALAEYARSWLDSRDLKPRTRYDYQRLLDRFIVPDLGDVPLERLTPTTVRTWYAKVSPGAPVQRARAYGLLKAICATAAKDEVIASNPCRVTGGGSAERTVDPRPATLDELAIIVEEMPDRYRAMVLFAAWTALRFGELAALTRDDIDLGAGVVRVRRAVSRVGSEFIVGSPKSAAGRRTVSIPPHVLPAIEAHLDTHVGAELDSLLFPARHGGHIAPSSVYKCYYPAREKAGRPDLRWHDLRHTGSALAAAAGASLPDLMARLGHSTTKAAQVYLHTAADRDAALAARLSAMAEGGSSIGADSSLSAGHG